jgi:serine protease Do
MFGKTILVLGALVLLVAAAPATPPSPPTPSPAPHAPHPPGHPRDVIFFSSGGSWLGVSIADISAERAKELKLREESGAEIRAVSPGSPAEEAGLKEEDVILEYQGSRVEGSAQLTRMVRETPPGRTVTLEIWRDGSPRSVKVKVAEHERPHGPGRMIDKRRIEIPHIDIPEIDIPDIDLPEIEALGSIPVSVRLGASVENLTEQLGEYFGVKGGEGALVRSVHKASPGEEAGLRAGDIIIKVDDERIADTSDLRSALRGRRGKEITLTVVRDRREQRLTVAAPSEERPPEESSEESALRLERLRRDLERSRDEMRAVRVEVRKAIAEARRSFQTL